MDYMTDFAQIFVLEEFEIKYSNGYVICDQYYYIH